METRAQTDDPVLRRLREEFTGHRIWRSRRWDGGPGEWVATLLDPAAGVDATVMRPNSAELREALVQEGRRAGCETKRAW
ncbi:hypothetical protein [Actinomadura sp. 9N215]|uniref:hypothetical protein n=1 Tax=Actinomadura sp. 9N215 TaxID=3375150 RepID=UPI003790F4A4